MSTVDAASLGLAQFCARVQEFVRSAWVTFPHLHFDETDDPHCSFDGERVAWRWRMRCTMTGPIEPPGFAPTGRTIAVEGVDLWTMRDGGIARSRAYYDMSAVARRLGIAPAPGSVGEKAVAAFQRLQARLIRRRSA